MRSKLLILIVMLLPWVAHANPVMLEPQSLVAFGIVAFFALVVESGIATLAVIGFGGLIVPFFMILVVANVAVFFSVFLPLIDSIPLWILEPAVVLLDGLVIKILTSLPYLEGSSVTWQRAFTASLLGNIASYFVGVIANNEPWFVHM